MGLKESLKELAEKEKLSVKREVKKELTKITKEKILEKKCIICEDNAKYSIKGSNDYYCKDCAIEYFGDLSHLKKIQASISQKKFCIYVAGKFEKKDIILDLYQQLKKQGHEISYDWTTHKNIKPYSENQSIARGYAENELNGICRCDVFIYLADEHGTTLPMEFGAALALSKTKNKPIVYAVGKFNDKSPWFFNKKVRRRNDINQVIKELKK